MNKPPVTSKQNIRRIYNICAVLMIGAVSANAFSFFPLTHHAVLMGDLDSRSSAQSKRGNSRESKVQAVETDFRFTFEQGAIIRGDRKSKKLAIVFTGDEFADGAEVIAQALKRRGVKASFFFTGRFYRNADFKSAIQTLKRDAHYLGAHSDAHLLYCDWNDRQKLLISRREFEEDLDKNYAAMRAFGISKSKVRFFLPPFEWYNRSIGDWTKAMDLQLINFTAGTRSNADYTTPETKNYVSGEAILKRIKEYEAQDPDGLNGFILLLHIGTAPARTDKFYYRLDELLEWLKAKKYEPVRIDQLLKMHSKPKV
jgi:peptidoglycan/xylan/chitin deacetylase (PgdA/CDA1 family)